MTTPNRIGIGPGPFLTQSPQVRENTRTGSETEWVFEGTYSECLAQRAAARAQGASQIAFGPLGDGNWRVQYTYPYGEFGWDPYTPSIHELEVNVGQLEWWRNPKVQADFTQAQIKNIGLVLRKYQSGMYSDPQPDNAESDLNTQTGNNADCLSLFKALAYNGSEAYVQYNTVYRRTLTAATPLQVQASYAGSGQIWTSAEVMAYEGLSPAGWFQLDAGMQFLKSRPQVIATANQKTQLIYTYTEIFQALSFFYDAWGSATLFTPA